MVKNNHFEHHKVKELNDELLFQPFDQIKNSQKLLNQAIEIAKMYAKVEGCVCVLSDLKENKNHFFYGKGATEMGLDISDSKIKQDGIWEEEIFRKIHPDDLMMKYLTELIFFQFLKNNSLINKDDFYVKSSLRMKNKHHSWSQINHRMYYLFNTDIVWLALCLYQIGSAKDPATPFKADIINKCTGEILDLQPENKSLCLSKREKEVLGLIQLGKTTKEIAITLFISVHTVSRHKQNIMEKLNVNTSFKAFTKAKKLGIL